MKLRNGQAQTVSGEIIQQNLTTKRWSEEKKSEVIPRIKLWMTERLWNIYKMKHPRMRDIHWNDKSQSQVLKCKMWQDN